MADRKLYGEDVEVPTFAEALEEEVQRNGSLPIHPSGRVAKSVTDWGGPSKKDKEWWLQQGPLMVERWAALRESQGWDICMMPDGKLGVEWGFEIPIGGTTLRGYIDRIVQDSQGRVLVVDLKAGSNEPSGGDLQFKTYGVALSRVFGIQADAGWFAKVGHSDPEKQLGGPHFLASGDEQYLEPVIQMWRKGVGNGVFIPNVTALCKGCTVREHCKAMNGVMARKHPYVDIEFKPPSFFAHVSSLVDQEEDAE